MGTKPKIHFMLGSHMDLFWMGPTRDCLDAGCDIINRAIELCDEYPEYCFYIESTVFAEYYLKNFPEKREKFMELIHEGRFDIACAYADRYEHPYGGETILRHHVVGKRWLRNELGIDLISTCHSDLPGLSPQVPQICAEAGISYYLRARGPCGVYDWIAPDGTRLIYCSVGYSYGKTSDERRSMEIAKFVEDMKSGQEILPHYVMRGGYGDLEMADEDIITDVKSFAEKFPELDFAISSPTPVMKYYLDNPELMDKMPKISGEWPMGWASICAGFPELIQKDLYLENYLLAVEKITALSGLYGGKLSPKIKEAKWWIAQGRIKGEITPPPITEGTELDEMWKAQLYGQDHNYSGFGGPKSELDRSIIKLYCEKYADDIMNCGMSYIDEHIALPETVKTADPIFRILVFNQMAWCRDAMISVDLPEDLPGKYRLIDSCGEEVLFEIKEDSLIFNATSLPSMGFKTYYIAKPAKILREAPFYPEWGGVWEQDIVQATRDKQTPWYAAVQKDSAYLLETPCYKLLLDTHTGTISSLYDKTLDKELVKNTADKLFGEVTAYEESGPDVIYNFTGRLERDSDYVNDVRISASDISVTIEVESTLFYSTIIKQFTFYREKPTVGIKVTVYWWGKMSQHLRLCMPFASDNYSETNYGVPFYSMTWPKMMDGVDDDIVLGVGAINPDEIDAHSRLHIRDIVKWLDVGYENYGVALASKTTCMYIDNNLIEATILRTGVSCGDPHVSVTNAGKQEINLELNPHAGGWKEADVYRYGWEYANMPIHYISEPSEGSGIISEGETMFATDCKNVIVSTVKPAYDVPGAVVVRFFETHGVKGDITLSCPKAVNSALLVNLLEEVKEKGILTHSDKEIKIPVEPYQIVNVLIEFK